MKEECSKCADGANGCACHRRWAHWVIKLLVLIFVFWGGVQFGELRGMLRAAYPGYSVMGAYGTGDQGYISGPMMGRVFYNSISATTTPRQ